MSKIAIFHNSPVYFAGEWKSICFYDSLIKSLIEQGNDILQFITNDFLIKAWNGTNEARNEDYKKQVHEALIKYNPDVVISFNNSAIEGIEEIVGCPIVLWEADSLSYFNDKETIKKKIGRYHLFAFSDFGARDFQEKFNPDPKQIYRVRNATSVQAKPVEQVDNISFIGTCFNIPIALYSLLCTENKKALQLIKQCENKNESQVKELIQQYGWEKSGLKTSDIMFCRTSQNRMQTLGSIAPLGIRIFGDAGWKNSYQTSLDLAMSYDDRLVFTLKHNETVYNRSKISINISHVQAITAYPWRVLDILASNAALVSDPKADLIADFGSKVKLQMYDTPYDAYKVCKRLLDEENLRQDVVQASQEAIDAGYRWPQRFKEMEQILGISLCNNGKQGSCTRFAVSPVQVDKLIEKAGFQLYKGWEKYGGLKRKRKSLISGLWKYNLYKIMPPSVQNVFLKINNHKLNKGRTIFE